MCFSPGCSRQGTIKPFQAFVTTMWKKPWKLTDGFIVGGGLVITGLLLQICWWGINYLPSAQGLSVHSY